MKNGVPVSVTNYDTFSLLYFELENVPQYQMVESAYLLLEMGGSMTRGEVRCYLNERNNYWSQNDSFIKQSYVLQNSYKNEVMIDISESYHALVSGMKENNGIIVEYGNDFLYACQMYVVYRQEIIAPRCRGMGFFEKKISVSSIRNEAVSPFFLTANATMVTFCINNFGKYPIYVFIENSPDAKRVFADPQRIEVLPNEMGVIIPTYFTKYVRLGVTSSFYGIVTEVWYQCQQK